MGDLPTELRNLATVMEKAGNGAEYVVPVIQAAFEIERLREMVADQNREHFYK